MAEKEKTVEPSADASPAGVNGMKAIVVEPSERYKKTAATREAAEKASKRKGGETAALLGDSTVATSTPSSGRRSGS